MKIHQVIIRDKAGNLMQEARYKDGLLYKQNRSYDLSICFDDFIDRLNTTKREIDNKRYSVEYNVLSEEPTKWLTA